MYLFQRQRQQAVAEAERAVALAPTDAEGYLWLGWILNYVGRPEEGITKLEQAMRLNPQYPFFYLWTLGHAYYLTGRSAEAIATLKKLVEQNPNFLPAHAFLSILYSEQGRDQDARAEAMAASMLSPQASLESLRQLVPYRNEKDLERFLAGMRKAGIK